MTAITLYLTFAIERPYQSSTWGKKALTKGKKAQENHSMLLSILHFENWIDRET